MLKCFYLMQHSIPFLFDWKFHDLSEVILCQCELTLPKSIRQSTFAISWNSLWNSRKKSNWKWWMAHEHGNDLKRMQCTNENIARSRLFHQKLQNMFKFYYLIKFDVYSIKCKHSLRSIERNWETPAPGTIIYLSGH